MSALTPLKESAGQEQAQRLDSGIWRVRSRMPGHSFGVLNSYLLEADDGLVLIDTPWGLPEVIAELEEGIRLTGHSPSDIRTVLVTHYHEDHSGAAGWFQTAYGASVGMHPADALNRNRRFEGDDFADVLEEWADETGVDDASRAYALRQYRELSSYAHQVVVDRPLDDGVVLPGALGGLRVIHTPGHTPGSVSFFSEHTGIVFTGDHVFDRRRANAVARPFCSRHPIGDYWNSMRRLLQLDPALVLPAHDGTITDLAGRAEQLSAVRETKLAEVIRLADGRTAWQIAQRIERRSSWEELDGNAKLAATGEALAYLYEGRDEGFLIAGEEQPVCWTAGNTDTEQGGGQ